jgi:hypothetical protein
MNTASNERILAPSIRGKLLVGTAALAVLQLVHLLDVLRYDDTASFPGVLADRQAVVGIGLASMAFLALVLRHPPARVMTIVASAVVALGFVLHHGIPVHFAGLTNPYWTSADGNRADWFRWTTVLVIIVVGAFTGMAAWRAPRDIFDERP